MIKNLGRNKVFPAPQMQQGPQAAGPHAVLTGVPVAQLYPQGTCDTFLSPPTSFTANMPAQGDFLERSFPIFPLTYQLPAQACPNLLYFE